MTTNKSAAFTVLFRSVGHWQKCNPRRTSQKIWGGFLYGVHSTGNDFELTPTVKMETRHPVEGSFISEFPAICNHCGVIAVGSLKTPKRAVK